MQADFELLSAQRTFVDSKKPVLAVCAVRTGCGKSQMSRYAINVLKRHNLKAVRLSCVDDGMKLLRWILGLIELLDA